MNTTYIIGNGFDINLGLHTQYEDFYKWYVALPSEKDPLVVKNFKKEINKYIGKKSSIDWSDLEVALGVYTTRVHLNEFHYLYFDIVDNLKKYLIEEYDRFDIKKYKSATFKWHLVNPIVNNFNVARKRILAAFRDKFIVGSEIINVVSFNYTRSIEDIIGYKGKEMEWMDDYSGRSIKFCHLYHIHRTLSEQNILVGVNDSSQIGNGAYRQNLDVCDYLVKPSANQVLNDYLDIKCESLINETNLFVLYGTSVGMTDKRWWKLIAERLISSGDNARLIWFAYSPRKTSHSDLLYKSEERKLLNQFINVAEIKDTDKDKIKSRIFVTLSNKLFSNLDKDDL